MDLLLEPADTSRSTRRAKASLLGVQIRALLGYLPGSLTLYERMRGEDLLAFFARMRGGVPASAYRGLAERFDLDLGRRVGELSRGNRQKLGVVQAFMHSPRLLVLDEPTSGLESVGPVGVSAPRAPGR